jgi:putative glutathione S-transferase
MIDGIWRGDVAMSPPDLEVPRAIHAGVFRDRLSHDSAALFPIERDGRYHLYVSYACPFAHRTLLARALLGLDDDVGLSVLHPVWNTADGWVFGDTPFSTPDLADNGFTHLHQAYAASAPCYTGKVTVPVLWDTRTRRIVSNESLDILHMLDSSFPGPLRLRPDAIAAEVDALGAAIAADVARGAYAVGAARDQAKYDTAIARLFGRLETLNARLTDGRPFLHGAAPAASDVLLFTPLVRFDTVYNPLFRASLRRLVDYPHLSAWARRFHALPGVAATVRLDHILRHYHDGDWGVAVRRGIVPMVPAVDYLTPPPT